MYLFDTNVLSELRVPDRANEAVWLWANQIHTDDVHISVISILEIEMGILRAERKDALKAKKFRIWRDNYILPTFEQRILNINTDICLACAKLHIPNPSPERDAFIGATALVHDMTLVTRNTKDFENTGVKLINPWLT